MEKIIEHLLKPGDQLIKYGQLTPNVLLEAQMTTSLYDYMEVIWNYYTDEKNPYRINWIDVEGMGYGWAWSVHEEKDWHRMMARMIARETKCLERFMEDTLYVVYESERGKTFHFVTLTEEREDILFNFLNKEKYDYYA